MEERNVNIVAKNFPEVLDILHKKFIVSNILDKERKFLRFEGKNFVYRYRMKVTIKLYPPKCSKCGYPIEGKVAWFECKQVCGFCFKTLTKGYYK